MKTAKVKVNDALSGDASLGALQSGLFSLPDELAKLNTLYRASRPGNTDLPDALAHKRAAQDEAFAELMKMTSSLIETKGNVSQPVQVTRKLTPLFDKPRYEVRSLDGRMDAEPGRPLFVTADPSLEAAIVLGDIVVVSADGKRILDVDNGLARNGEEAVIIGMRSDGAFPYELELTGEDRPAKRTGAIAWERLRPKPVVGDHVKVMGGVIYAYGLEEAGCRYKNNVWRNDLDTSDLSGSVPRRTLRLILSMVHRHFHSEHYPVRPDRYQRNALLLYGPPGVGKTWAVTVAFSILQNRYNNGKEHITFLSAEGSSIEGSLVGSGPRALREIRSAAKQALSKGKLPVTFINEAGALLRSREIQGQMLDGGSSLTTHEQFLSMLSGPDEIPGLIIVDLNTEKSLDEATRQRFSCVAFPHIDRATMVDEMFHSAFEKSPELFYGTWEEIRTALTSSLDTAIGSVLVGSDTVPVTVGHLTSGRLYDHVIRESLGLVDLTIYSASEQETEPLFKAITTPLLYYALTHRAWSLFTCWNDAQARERLVPEIARPEKAASISRPTPLAWHEIKMPDEYDCRGPLDELIDPAEGADLVTML